LTKGLLLLALWSSTTALLKGNWIALAASLALWLYLLVVLYVQGTNHTVLDLHRFGNWLFICGFISAAIGLAQYFGLLGLASNWLQIVFGMGGFVADPEGRLSATFANANLAGAWFGVLTLLAVYFFHHTEQKSYRNLYIVAIVVFAVMLVLTGSRGALMGTMIGLFVYFYFSYKYLRLGLTILFSIAVLTALIHPQLIPRINLWDLSLMDRMHIWKISWQLFTQHPLDGVGLAGMYFIDPAVTGYYRLAHAHNTVLAFFVELGFVGGLIFIWMHSSLAVYLYRLNQLDHPLAPIYMALATVFLVHGLMDHTIMTPQVGILYILLLGCVSRTWNEVAEERALFRLRVERNQWPTGKTV
jgi:O-antigen ligase